MFTDCFTSMRSRYLSLTGSRRAREVTAREKSPKSGIGSVGIPLGIDGQIDEMHIVRIVRAVQPFEDRLALTEACVHERHRVGRHVPLARNRVQRRQQRAGLTGAPDFRENVPPERDGLVVLAREPGCGRQGFQGQLVLTQLLVRLPAHHVPDPEFFVEDDRLPGEVESRGIVAGLKRDQAGVSETRLGYSGGRWHFSMTSPCEFVAASRKLSGTLLFLL